MKKYLLGISFMIAVTIIAVAACSKSDSGNTPTRPGNNQQNPPPTTADATVTIKDFAFGSGSVTIKPGQTVQWKNSDATPHTVTDNNGGFDSGTINAGGKFSHTFATAGTYTYHCTFHSTMATATVIVAP
ncbi:plastocyanin/azurin family copper-binding protein [Mucilaginibacter sp. AK015]|uniref:plastocyanin/azurin family copper-binding protein n=1 Tax=Mucilaginibacter sp. AK015 TaxID=2723072 RepID=UPI00160DFB9B|nr:plastocyanin/azurin family copper-binding protein [Mucilaginibacter sp. AK015]MBB5397598.1 plastocyanin [Mucilaginibacter sp. AK015]